MKMSPMASEGPIECSVITPEREVLSAKVASVVFTAHDGQMGVLKNRAPFLGELGTGVLRVTQPSGSSSEFFVDRGFAHVHDNHVTILTEHSAAVGELSRTDAQAELAAAERMPAKGEAAIQNARIKITLARK
jgi:F-type H+-transporting ATPase subunit epsilon